MRFLDLAEGSLRARGLASIVVLVAAASACSAVIGIDGLVPDREGAGGASASASASSGASVTSTGSTSSTGSSSSGGSCTSTCGTPGCGDCPAKTGVAVQAAKGNYAIDAHEVTVAEYKAFFAASVATSAQTPFCAWNDSFKPGDITDAAKKAAADGGHPVDPSLCKGYFEALGPLDDKKPIVCVDWCDAFAYCAWAKKRLCGAIGGGTIDTTPPKDKTAFDPESSEWYRACSKAGAQKYPYGNTYMPGVCNDEGHGVTNVDKYTGCEGGYQGIFEMSGNVWQWVDECTQYQNPPVAQNCLRRGGAYYSDPASLACDEDDPTIMSVPSDNTGFRCCDG